MSPGGFKRLVLLILVSILAVLVGGYSIKGEWAVTLFQFGAYWFTSAGVALWVYAGWQLVKTWDWNGGRILGRGDWPWLGTALVITFLAVFIHQEPGLKIVNDEPSQLATAKALFEQREAAIFYRAYDTGQGQEPTHAVVDKRPILYAWLVAQAHALTGYREANGFWVTRILAMFTTVALYVLGRRMAGRAGGAILALLLLLPPMQAHLANAGGFEMMNLLFIVLLGLGIYWYFDRPCEQTESWLALTFVLLAGLRYESVVFAFPVVLAVLVGWRRGHAPRLGWMTLVAPLLLIPRLWLQEVFARGDSWQLQSKPEAAGEPFAWRFFYDNVGHSLSYAFSFDWTSTNSVVLSGLGLGCAGFWVMLLSRKCRSRAAVPLSDWAPYVLWFGLSLHLGLMLVYFWGQFDDPLTQRLALPVHLWLAMAVVGVFATLNWRERWQVQAVALLALLFFVLTVPQLRANRFYEINHTSRAQNKVRQWMVDHPDPSRLVINHVAMATWLSGGNAVVSIQAVRKMPERIRYQWGRGTFSEVLVLMRESYDPRTAEWAPIPEDDLGPDFDYEEVWNMWCTPIYRFRLARVIAIRNEHPDWEPTELTSEESGELWKARGEYFREWSGKMP